MDLEAFVELVFEMRRAQSEYSRTRSRSYFLKSKELEDQVDRWCREYVNERLGLFRRTDSSGG